jgi:hypothetical protein
VVDRVEFWHLYSSILSFIANSRDKNGKTNFEANTITKLYEEIIQASHGTRWVLALTIASSIEALAKMLVPAGAKNPDYEPAAASALNDHIDAWTGPKGLKSIAVNAIKRSSDVTVIQTLRNMQHGAISQKQFAAFKEIRNSVSHGNLMLPYSTEEEDGKVSAMIELMHILTCQIIAYK